MKNLIIFCFLVSFVSCDINKSQPINELNSIEDKELRLKTRHDTILQNILLGMYRTKVDSIINNSNSFLKLGKEYCYQFSAIPLLSDINWHIYEYGINHNDSLVIFDLAAYNFDFIEKGIIMTKAFNALCINFKIKYGDPKFIKDKDIGPYYWVDGNREIKIEMDKNDNSDKVNHISISYSDLTRRITPEMLPLEIDENGNTYTKSYWDNIKTKELKAKIKSDL